MELVLVKDRKYTSKPVGTRCSFEQAQDRARQFGASLWILKDDRKSVIMTGKVDYAKVRAEVGGK